MSFSWVWLKALWYRPGIKGLFPRAGKSKNSPMNKVKTEQPQSLPSVSSLGRLLSQPKLRSRKASSLERSCAGGAGVWDAGIDQTRGEGSWMHRIISGSPSKLDLPFIVTERDLYRKPCKNFGFSVIGPRKFCKLISQAHFDFKLDWSQEHTPRWRHLLQLEQPKALDAIRNPQSARSVISQSLSCVPWIPFCQESGKSAFIPWPGTLTPECRTILQAFSWSCRPSGSVGTRAMSSPQNWRKCKSKLPLVQGIEGEARAVGHLEKRGPPKFSITWLLGPSPSWGCLINLSC